MSVSPPDLERAPRLDGQGNDAPAAPAPLGFHVTEALIAIWATLFLVLCYRSLDWRMMHDAPLMQYIAWLIRRGYRPYVDLFDMNMPGTYAINVIGQMVFGEGDRAFRRADLVWMALTSIALWRCIRPIDPRAGLVAAFMMATTYLMGSPWETMQRDWLLLLPIYVAFAEVLHDRPRPARLVLAGVALALDVLIKPQTVVLLPFFAALLLLRREDWLRRVIALASGAGVPLLAAGVWLYVSGGLEPFLWSWQHYLGPLYSKLNGVGWEVQGGLTSFLGTATETFKMMMTLRKGPVVVICIAGALLAWRNPGVSRLSRLRIVALLALTVYGLAHAIFPNKLWAYHFWPFYGAAVPLGALLAMGVPRAVPTMTMAGMTRLIAPLFPLHGILAVSLLLAGVPERERVMERNLGRVDQLTATLRRLARPGDRLQVLDTTGGALHAAMNAKLEPGSRFIYDFHFFHHMGDPAVQRLRGLLIEDLTRIQPRFVAVWRLSWAHRTSFEDLERFPELTALLHKRYRLVEGAQEYRLYERRGIRSDLSLPGAR